VFSFEFTVSNKLNFLTAKFLVKPKQKRVEKPI
jgi:hypothetical protein